MAVEVKPPAEQQVRCWRCQKLLAVYLTPPWCIECPRCHARNASQPEA